MRVLACFAHPDDESFTSAGTLALLAREGHEIVLLTATRGENGRGPDVGDIDSAELASLRERELRAATEVLGIAELRLAGLPDGGVRAGLGRLQDEIVAVAGRFSPDALLTFGADGAYGHPDHRAVHVAAKAVFPLTGAKRLLCVAYPAGLFAPQYDLMLSTPLAGEMGAREDLGVQTGARLVNVDITTMSSTKLDAIACHRSQLSGGDPRTLFPPGLVDATLTTEWFEVAAGHDAGDGPAFAALGAVRRPTSTGAGESGPR